MTQPENSADWLWVIIENPGRSEQLLGQHLDNEGIDFIPAFRQKDHAQLSMGQLERKPNTKYEAQAIHVDDLKTFAGESKYLVFILDEEGKILGKIHPE